MIEMTLKTLLKMHSGEKFSKGTLVVDMSTAYLENTFENAQWRKISKAMLVIEMDKRLTKVHILFRI